MHVFITRAHSYGCCEHVVESLVILKFPLLSIVQWTENIFNMEGALSENGEKNLYFKYVSIN